MARRDFLKHLGFHSQTTLCMSKRLFQILDEMNQNDDKNRTATCACCFDLVGAKTANGGGHVTMGVPADAVHKIFIGDYQPFLILLNKKEYDRIEKASPAVAPNTQLPAEVLEEIKLKAEEYANRHINGRSQPEVWEIVFKANEAGATEYASKLHQVEQENAQLKQWKAEASTLLKPILDYGQSKEANFPLGESITTTVLERCKKHDTASTLLKKVVEKYGHLYEWNSGIINEIKTFLDGTK